jgi:hypothetical protein
MTLNINEKNCLPSTIITEWNMLLIARGGTRGLHGWRRPGLCCQTYRNRSVCTDVKNTKRCGAWEGHSECLVNSEQPQMRCTFYTQAICWSCDQHCASCGSCQWIPLSCPRCETNLVCWKILCTAHQEGIMQSRRDGGMVMAGNGRQMGEPVKHHVTNVV